MEQTSCTGKTAIHGELLIRETIFRPFQALQRSRQFVHPKRQPSDRRLRLLQLIIFVGKRSAQRVRSSCQFGHPMRWVALSGVSVQGELSIFLNRSYLVTPLHEAVETRIQRTLIVPEPLKLGFDRGAQLARRI